MFHVTCSMRKCFHCGKTLLFGRSHTHHRGVAGGRWKKRAPKTNRIFVPNLQKVEIFLNGNKKTVNLCTKCLKRVKKDVKAGVRPFLQLAVLQKKEDKMLKEEKKEDKPAKPEKKEKPKKTAKKT